MFSAEVVQFDSSSSGVEDEARGAERPLVLSGRRGDLKIHLCNRKENRVVGMLRPKLERVDSWIQRVELLT